MLSVIIIPSRYGSSRFPGKPLKTISGKSLLFRVWSIAQAVRGVDDVYIATDDRRILDHVLSFGGKAVMTPQSCKNGTERVFAALQELAVEPEIIINFQGDALLTPPWIIQALQNTMEKNLDVSIATPAVRLSEAEYKELKQAKIRGSSSGTLVTFNKSNEALYFSKTLIPFVRDEDTTDFVVYRHIGIYAYRFDTLRRYLSLKPGPLEKAEKLEQLRALEHGIPIKVVEVDYRGRRHCSIDNPEDVELAEKIIGEEGELVPLKKRRAVMVSDGSPQNPS